MQPKVLLELGTSLGVNTLYQALPNTGAKLYTFEGCPQTADIAKEYFAKAGIEPEVVVGNLDETLQQTVQSVSKIDYVFFDANHQYEPTLKYFKTCLTKADANSIFIFDDIHWSEGMERAWEEIKAHPKVSISIDLFQLGLIFFRDKQPKQHFVLKF